LRATLKAAFCSFNKSKGSGEVVMMNFAVDGAHNQGTQIVGGLEPLPRDWRSYLEWYNTNQSSGINDLC